jgi:hypothetical protein
VDIALDKLWYNSDVAALSAMKAFTEGELSVPTTKVKLVQRDEITDMLGSHYIVQSVLVGHSTGRGVQVHPYLQSGFF